MNWKLPNQLTMARLAISAVFFVLLACYGASRGLLLNACFVLYIVAGITDVLDGHLARRWGLTSAFGRLMDPFVDKVLVCGAFALLAGSSFIFDAHTSAFERSLPPWLSGGMASGVQAWMVVAVIAREFVVSAVRGYSESQGQKFPATVWGKLKMFSQSFAICTVLYQLANLPEARWAIILKLASIWLSVIITVFSGLAYLNRARALLVGDEPPAGPGQQGPAQRPEEQT